MKIRVTDGQDTDPRAIRRQRSSTNKWIQTLVAILVAVVSALGGTTYIQMQDAENNPSAHADTFTDIDGKDLEARILREIAENTVRTNAFDAQRWNDIGDKVERQYQTVKELTAALAVMITKVAEGHERDTSMLHQIDENRSLILQHLGAIGSGTGGHGGRSQQSNE